MTELITSTPPQATFSYSDIARGISNEVFYGGSVLFLSGANLISGMVLSNKTFYSANITSKATITSTAWGFQFMKNFDLDFGLPRQIKGNVIVNIPTGANSLSNVQNAQMYNSVYLIKVAGDGTETLLVSGSTLVYNAPLSINSDTPYSRIDTMNLIAPLTKFRKGEKLRLQIWHFARNVGSATAYQSGIAHDPQNRNDNNEGVQVVAGTSGAIIQKTNTGATTYSFATDTILSVQIPFKVDA